MDKEFETLFPPEPYRKGVRFVDKLVKVHLKDGGKKYVLCHIEVQCSKGKGDLAERMFHYYYKVYDKYKFPVTAIAILVDESIDYKPSSYEEEFMGTSIHYNFNCYKILDQEESTLRDDSNPFAVVALTTLMAIKNKKVSDEKLKEVLITGYRYVSIAIPSFGLRAVVGTLGTTVTSTVGLVLFPLDAGNGSERYRPVVVPLIFLPKEEEKYII